MAGLYAEDEEAVEEEGPIPRYPRGTLRLQLSDGSTTLNAFEYRKIPQLVLSETLQSEEDAFSDIGESMLDALDELERSSTMKGSSEKEIVISIDSDEDMDVKPEPPPPRPSQRTRTQGRKRKIVEDVIEISD